MTTKCLADLLHYSFSLSSAEPCYLETRRSLIFRAISKVLLSAGFEILIPSALAIILRATKSVVSGRGRSALQIGSDKVVGVGFVKSGVDGDVGE